MSTSPSSTSPRDIGVGLIGFGNIGTGVVAALNTNAEVMRSRLGGWGLKLVRIADQDITRRREAPYDPAILTQSADELIADPAVEIVIELVGGVEPARTFVEKALKAGKSVVTANKAMLATHGASLWALARTHGVGLYFEASVGGGIPIIRALQTGLSANRINRVMGILNGTCNFILTAMANDRRDFPSVLAEAQANGYAEPDPTYDIEGYDTAHKTAVLASLAFGQDIRFQNVHVEGITRLSAVDFEYAASLGYVIKLLGIASRDAEDGRVTVRVHPTLVPKSSLIASVDGVFNAVVVDGDLVGQTLFYGRGAGRNPTSSAILSDLMGLVADISRGVAPGEHRLDVPEDKKNLASFTELECRYMLRTHCEDRPGTMARLGTVLGNHKISIESMIQKPVADGTHAEIIIVTHRTSERHLQAAVKELDQEGLTKLPPVILRVEEV
jgi:homoserine dehydrogenase